MSRYTREKRKAQGLCIDCGCPSRHGLTMCQVCSDARVERNRVAQSQRAERRAANDECVRCGRSTADGRRCCGVCLRRQRRRDREARILSLHAGGLSQTAIAAKMGVSQTAISGYLRRRGVVKEPRRCSVPGCGRRHHAGGMCATHGSRGKSLGAGSTVPTEARTPEESDLSRL